MNKHLELFRVKVALLVTQWADRMKIFVAENRTMGNEVEAMRRMKNDPESPWSAEREALGRALKAEASGLVNRLHQAAHAGEL